MPDFTKAEVSNTSTDLSPYLTFLKRLEVGQVVTLPLEQGESPRRVMRALNLAAGTSSMRISRLPSGAEAVRFRVISPAKRTVNLTDEAKRARVAKAKATRAARKAELEQVAAMGMPVEAAGSSADQVLAEEQATVEQATVAGAAAASATRSSRRRRASA